MLTGVLIVVAAAVGTIVASWLMWWVAKRSALWAMAAGAVLALVAIGCAFLIAWLLTRAVYGR